MTVSSLNVVCHRMVSLAVSEMLRSCLHHDRRLPGGLSRASGQTVQALPVEAHFDEVEGRWEEGFEGRYGRRSA